MNTTLRTTGTFVALCTAFTLAACGGSGDKASPTSPTTSASSPATTTPTVPSATTGSPAPTAALPTAPTDGGTATCTTKQLAVTITPSADGNAAGSSYNDIVFSNLGPATCTMYGWPGVSYVGGGNGTQVGAPADRTGSPRILKLAPGKAATALLREIDAANFDDSCTIQLVDGLRIYPPNQKSAVFVAHKTHGCAAASIHTLVISPAV